jgi:thymidylate synthase
MFGAPKFDAPSVTDAWLDAAKFLCDSGEAVGLHVAIADPTSVDSSVVAELDRALAAEKHLNCKHVANTIFPAGLWRKFGNSDHHRLFLLYNRQGGYYDRLKRRRARSSHYDWGTYFQRLSSAELSGRDESQLSQAIRALTRKDKPRGAVHLHTGFAKDGIRKIGGPCLQSLTMHTEWSKGQPHLSACALYRNHDFFQKALGNYIGLGNLVQFVAESSQLAVGTLHVISGHAYCDSKRSMRQVLNVFGR